MPRDTRHLAGNGAGMSGTAAWPQVTSWLDRHQGELQAAEAAAHKDQGRVEVFLSVARSYPIDGLTPETLAASAVSARAGQSST